MRVRTGVFLLALAGMAGCYPGFKIITNENPPPDAAPPMDTGVDVPVDTGTDVPPQDACAMTACGAACVDTNADPNHCGGCGVVCPTVLNGRAVCMAGRCQRVCSEGQVVCGDRCVDTAADPAHCGGCGLACPTALQGRAVCRMGACRVECVTGFHLCEGRCVENTSVNTCGAACAPCPAPANGAATCDGLSCGLACAAGFSRCGAACVADVAPRPIAPLSTATVTSRRPTLRWSLPTGADGARVQLCRDRACAMVAQTFEVTGASVTPVAALDPGVYYWRLFRRAGGCVGEAASPAWQFVVGRRPTAMAPAADTSWGVASDFDGDGFVDVAVGAPRADMDAGRVYVFAGSMAGLAATARVTLMAPDGGEFGASVASAGDVDGDGFADLVVGAPAVGGGAGRVYVYTGGPMGLDRARVVALRAPEPGRFGASVAGLGDANGDGFGDLAVGAPEHGSAAGRVYVFHGRAAGPAATPATTLNAPTSGRFGAALAGAGDVNGDGLADLVVGAPAAVMSAGRAYVYHGDAGGYGSATVTLSPPDDGQFGAAVASAGDNDGDGYGDVVVGAPAAVSEAGRAYVYRGGRAGLDVAGRVALSVADGGRFGAAVETAGDTDGNGYDDLVVGAPASMMGTGRAYVFVGDATGLGRTHRVTLVPPDGGSFGAAVRGAGDLERDGYDDVVVGAPDVGTESPRAGAAYVFRGAMAGLGITGSPALAAPAPGAFGRALAWLGPGRRRARGAL